MLFIRTKVLEHIQFYFKGLNLTQRDWSIWHLKWKEFGPCEILSTKVGDIPGRKRLKKKKHAF